MLKVAVGCGKCYECIKQKTREWQIRLLEEIKNDNKAHFVTFTFSPDGLKYIASKIKFKISGYELDNEIATVGMRYFLENWRKRNKKSVKHWAITELGKLNTEHLHIHAVIWTDNKDEIVRNWKYGHTYIGHSINESVINYIIKYCSKTDILHKDYKPKILCSKGIGKTYLNKNNLKFNRYKNEDTKERIS